MAFSTQDGADDVVSEINITPLVDVMLVLLIVFIVTAPLMTNAVKVNLPKTVATQSPELKKPVNVSVDAQSNVFIDKAPITIEALETELKTRQAADPELALHLRADETVPYKAVAKTMAIIERAGITKLAVITSNQ